MIYAKLLTLLTKPIGRHILSGGVIIAIFIGLLTIVNKPKRELIKRQSVQLESQTALIKQQTELIIKLSEKVTYQINNQVDAGKKNNTVVFEPVNKLDATAPVAESAPVKKRTLFDKIFRD
jgi:hypothetical protein